LDISEQEALRSRQAQREHDDLSSIYRSSKTQDLSLEQDSGSESDEEDDFDDESSPESDSEMEEDEDLGDKEEEILKDALTDVEKMGGDKFNFDVKELFRKHLLLWRRKKDKDGGYDNFLKFRKVKESVGGGRTQTGKVGDCGCLLKVRFAH
jgi:hypothetical protein